MKVFMRIPKPVTREFPGRKRVADVLTELRLNPEAVIVIAGNRLLTEDTVVDADETFEIRPAISGGNGR